MNAHLKKICPLEEAGKNCEALKDSGKRIVFTNGCFDILHPGHARYLSSARELGDYLIVALNSDSFRPDHQREQKAHFPRKNAR